MKKLALVLLLLGLSVPASGARVRAVHHPANACTFTLAPTWPNAPVPAAGMTRGTVLVFGQSAGCTQFGGYSSADWVTVEAAPADAQPAAYVTVAPNPAAEGRTSSVVIAGMSLQIVQEAAPTVSDPNLVTNPSFHTGIDGWIWYDRFPNGRGTASWSALDASGNPASGSISLRDDGINDAFQRLQCLPASKSTNYRFGARVRTGAAPERGNGEIALVYYKTTDCSGDYTDFETRPMSPAEPGVWQEFSFTARTGSRTQSVILVIASAALMPPFETWLDDVFVRPE